MNDNNGRKVLIFQMFFQKKGECAFNVIKLKTACLMYNPYGTLPSNGSMIMYVF